MGLVVVILIAVGVVAYFVNSLLSGGAKDQMIAAASKSLKTKVDFQSYGLDFGSLIKLTPAVRRVTRLLCKRATCSRWVTTS